MAGPLHVWLGVLLAAAVAAPAMHYVWIVSLTGNANLLFNLGLAANVAAAALLAEFTLAALRVQDVQRRLRGGCAAEA